MRSGWSLVCSDATHTGTCKAHMQCKSCEMMPTHMRHTARTCSAWRFGEGGISKCSASLTTESTVGAASFELSGIIAAAPPHCLAPVLSILDCGKQYFQRCSSEARRGLTWGGQAFAGRA